jgi:hypothetical protein
MKKDHALCPEGMEQGASVAWAGAPWLCFALDFHALFPCCLSPPQILKPADQKARFAYRGGAMAGGTGGGGGAR